jgi:uncharacterized repeat protein (TIGR01451 family)
MYTNTGGALALAWSSPESDDTFGVAWGDWDGDGDLDLAAGNYLQQNRVYDNSSGTLSLAWSSSHWSATLAVAWGDWDNDGDLDLAFGNGGEPNRVYEYTGGPLALTWSSTEADVSSTVAWGDWDGDGDLDLATANGFGAGRANRVYENSGGALVLAWTSSEEDDSRTTAWGDVDNDGDLDLAVANFGQANRVYENSGGVLSLVWSTTEADDSVGAAWGDWDNDGDLDLAFGNYHQANRVYENSGGALSLAWSSIETDATAGVAWGDVDGDGLLDLAVGNLDIPSGQPDRVYHNTGGALTLAWSSSATDMTATVAWGDWDGDGDVDLATAHFGGENRVYENIGGVLSLAWSSPEIDFEQDDTYAVAWGDWDGDGDLDLAFGNDDATVGIDGRPNRVYENADGDLSLVWSSSESDSTAGIAWGDWDGDGDLDLAVANFGPEGSGQVNRVYDNGVIRRPGGLPESAVSPVLSDRPGVTHPSFFYSAAECLVPPVTVDYLLFDDEDDPARLIVAEYSPVGGGQWLSATAATGTITEELAASPSGTLHAFEWDAEADLPGPWADGLVFRITVPYQASTRLAGPIQRAAMSATSPPFRICALTADLAITKDDGQSEAVPGEPVTYTIVVANDGPDNVTGAEVGDVFPETLDCSWTCSASPGALCTPGPLTEDIADTADIPVGGSVTYIADCTVDMATSGTLANTAWVASPAGVPDPDSTNNSSTDTDTLLALGPCGSPDKRQLSDMTVDDERTFRACTSITADNFAVIAPAGDVTLRAGSWIALGNGFAVEAGCDLTIDIDPTLVP